MISIVVSLASEAVRSSLSTIACYLCELRRKASINVFWIDDPERTCLRTFSVLDFLCQSTDCRPWKTGLIKTTCSHSARVLMISFVSMWLDQLIYWINKSSVQLLSLVSLLPVNRWNPIFWRKPTQRERIIIRFTAIFLANKPIDIQGITVANEMVKEKNFANET